MYLELFKTSIILTGLPEISVFELIWVYCIPVKSGQVTSLVTWRFSLLVIRGATLLILMCVEVLNALT